jgi:carbonic anhydrase
MALFAAVATAQSAANYNFDKAGADWEGLCANGKAQSPVDIVTSKAEYAEEASLGASKYTSYKADIRSQISQHGFYVKFSSGILEYTNQNGKVQRFQPLGFKIKSPSEHTVNGKNYAVEVQFVHKYMNTDDELGSNFSIFFDPSASTRGGVT